METGQLQNEEALVSDTTDNLYPTKENELIKSSETKGNTKSILESICSDFQNIDVFSPNNKLPKEAGLPGNSSEINKSSNTNSNNGAGPSVTNAIPISNHVTKAVKDSNSEASTSVVPPVKDSPSQTCTVSAAANIKAAIQQCGIQKPVCGDSIVTNNKIISSSLAEVADAEIVQTDDNLVSIIITNPRLIQVLNSEDGKQQYSSLPQTVSAVSQVGSVAESVAVEPAPVAQQDLAFQSEISAVTDEIVYDGDMQKSPKKKRKYQFSSTPKGKTKAAVLKQKTDSGKITKARRISAKMKIEWAKTLAKKGSLVCPMQGCYQKYVTIANFVTHYKFCPGQTELKHCPHCSSLIFSDNKAMLHHMEVEHPDKVEEFKANFSDDESSALYDEEEIPETPIQVEKRKISSLSKENQSPKGRKHKIFKSIAHETEIENIKEFRKCVRFDNIVSKINSCDQVETPDVLETSVQPTHSKSPKERKRRLILTGKIVEEEKYFEDADDFLTTEPKQEVDNLKLNTKSRLVLNLERYKQFNQHLKLTRDWSSARKTYSRSRISDSSLDSSFTSVQTITDCPKDDHQLDDLRLKSSTGENDTEVIYYANIPKELSEYDLQDPKAIQRTRPSLISQSNSERKRVGILKEKVENTKEIESQIAAKPSVYISPSPDKPQNGFVLKEKKVPCYLRDTIANSTPKSTPEVRKAAVKAGPVITYGKNVPAPEEKNFKAEKSPVIDFDTLFKNSMKEMKLLRERTEPVAESVSEVKHSKQNGVKEPVVEKRKRGRPKKIRALPEEEQTNANTNTKEAGIKMVNGEKNIHIEPNATKAKKLKNYQARAYIKSKRQRSIKNLNSKRVNQSHMTVIQDSPSTMIDNTKTNEVTVDNISIKTNVTASFPDKTMPEFQEQNSCTSTGKSNKQTNELQQNLDIIPQKGALSSRLEIEEPNKPQTDPNKDINEEKSVECALRDAPSISNNTNSDAKQKTEILTPVTVDTDAIAAKPSCVHPVAKELCSVEAIPAPSAHNEEVSAKANVPSSSDTQILNVTEPVKRRRGRPKKIVHNANAKLHTAAISTDGLHSETVQSKTVPSEAGQSEAAQSDAGQSEPAQSDTGQSEATQSDAGQSETAKSDAGQSEAAKSDAGQSKAAKSDAGQSETAQSDAGQSEAAQSDAGQSAAAQSDAGQSEAAKSDAGQSEAAKSDAGQSEAAKSDAGQSEAAQSDAEQSEATQADAGQSQAAQSDAGHSDTEQLDVQSSTVQSVEQSVAIQSDVGQSVAIQSDVGQSVAIQSDVGQSVAVQSDVGQSVAVQSNVGQSVAIQSDVGQSVAVQFSAEQSLLVQSAAKESDAGQSVVVHSDTVQSVNAQSSVGSSVETHLTPEHSNVMQSKAIISDRKQSDVPLRKSLRNRNRNSSLPNDDFVFPTTKKESTLLSSEEHTPPVKTGRRGRPRKYPLKIDLNSSASETILKDDLNSSTNEHTLKIDLNVSASEAANESMNSVKDSTEPLSISQEQALPEKKKCGRPRKYPLKRDLNSSVSESDNCTEFNKSKAPARKRGRPRKHPRKSDLVTSKQLNNSVDSDKPINESKTSHKSLRKCPRKSRPVKCVHFEALNSHSSPPLAGDIIQEKKVEANLDSSRVKTEDTPSTVKNKDSTDPTACSKPEKFILPPKKRKISGEGENITLSKEKAQDPDYLESGELSDEESELERTRKLKKRTEDDLPYVPEKRLKRQLKKSHSPSKKAAVTPTKPSFEFLAKFTGAVYEEKELYPNLKPIQSMFTNLSEGEWQEYLPPVESISIRLDTAECEKNWVKLKCFESLSNGALKYLTFFSGGPVSTSAFCPTPHNKISGQYIALASNYNFFNVHYSSTKTHKGLIQIYNLGNLQDLNPPALELALCHKNATITDMQWCPRGCYQEPQILSNKNSTSNVLPRLGLLAVACADSFVRIYSIPHPQFLTALKVSRVNSLPFFNSSPSVILEPMCGATRSSIATSLTWANTAACEQIAVGYGNGMVGVWLVNTTNSILLTSETALGRTIIPYLVFQAHGTPVTSLQFAPLQNCRYLVSSGFDKTLKFFDLMDTSIPFCSAKRGCAISCQWSSSICGAFVSLHDGITYKGSNYFKDAGTEEFPIQTISGSISSLTQSCVSDAINVLATADMKGSVSVKLFAKNTLCGSDPGKLPPLHAYKLFKAEVTSFQDTAKKDMKDIKDSILHLKDVIDITTELTSQVERDIISENNKAIEKSISEVMDDILMTTVKNSNLLLMNEKQHICEIDVLNLMTSLCESAVHSMNSVVEESSQEETKSMCEDISSKLEDNVPHSNNNVDSHKMADIDDTTVLKDSDNLGTTSKQIIEESDSLTKASDSPLLYDKPCNVSEVLAPDHLKLEVNSSVVNSFVSENDSEVTGASINTCTNNPQNDQDTETTVLPTPNEGKQEFDSQEISQIVDVSDEDSFSSEDMDSDKESDIASDEELNFSDDSMMSECSLSSKSSESSYSSDNAMDESVSIDYIQDIEFRCSPIPHDTPLTEGCVGTSESKCNPTSNDLSLIEDCTQNSESKSSPMSNATLTELRTQNSESFDAPVTEDCIETTESKGSPTPSDSALTEDCSQTIDSNCSTSPDGSTLTEIHNSSSPEISSDSGVVGMSDSQEIVVNSSSPANITDNGEISNNDLPESDFAPRTLDSEICVSTECDSAVKSAPSKDPAPKNLEPSIQQFYKQQTRTSKPYMQAFKSASEASVNNIEYENSIGETMADTESEACINHCSSYEDIVSNHGIVFKDMHLGNTAECTITNEDEMDKLPALDHNNFSSVNTIAWNPNHGCEYWLFSAGNSGIARLCCVSEINVPDRMMSRRKYT